MKTGTMEGNSKHYKEIRLKFEDFNCTGYRILWIDNWIEKGTFKVIKNKPLLDGTGLLMVFGKKACW